MTDKYLYLVWITCASNFSPTVREFLELYSPEEIYSFSYDDMLERGFSPALSEKLSDKRLKRAERILEVCRRKNIYLIPYNSSFYPKKLKSVKDAPLILYVKGLIDTLDTGVKIGFVGTRRVSDTGERFARHLAGNLVQMGALLITGGASGCDTFALQSAVSKGKGCVAVLGCDIDRYYPSTNYALFEHVTQVGLVISEYPPETCARYFPYRNRIIAALSDRLVVAAAPEKSGALITADYAFKYGVPVFAPDFAGEEYAGCRKLVGAGAYTIESAEHIIKTDKPIETNVKIIKKKREHHPLCFKKVTKQKPVRKEFSDSCEEYVYNCILNGKNTLEHMAQGEFTVPMILTSLSMLEMSGVIECEAGGQYNLK